MKTLRQIVESAIATVSGGLFVDDRNIYVEQIEQKVHEARSIWIAQSYKASRSIHPDWYQRYYPEYIEDIQEDKCITTFNVPHIIWFDDKSDGMRYFGAKGYADNFTRIWDRTMLSSMMRHEAMAIGRRNYILIQNGIGECYTISAIREPIMEAIFSCPTDIPTFNRSEHQYPIDPQGIDFIEKYLVQTVLKMEIATPADVRNDGVDSTKLPK